MNNMNSRSCIISVDHYNISISLTSDSIFDIAVLDNQTKSVYHIKPHSSVPFSAFTPTSRYYLFVNEPLKVMRYCDDLIISCHNQHVMMYKHS